MDEKHKHSSIELKDRRLHEKDCSDLKTERNCNQSSGKLDIASIKSGMTKKCTKARKEEVKKQNVLTKANKNLSSYHPSKIEQKVANTSVLHQSSII